MQNVHNHYSTYLDVNITYNNEQLFHAQTVLFNSSFVSIFWSCAHIRLVMMYIANSFNKPRYMMPIINTTMNYCIERVHLSIYLSVILVMWLKIYFDVIDLMRCYHSVKEYQFYFADIIINIFVNQRLYRCSICMYCDHCQCDVNDNER